MAKLDYRYQALDLNGNILSTGNKIEDVNSRMGRKIIVDFEYKKRQGRFCVTGEYPAYREDWHTGDDWRERVSELLRRSFMGEE